MIGGVLADERANESVAYGALDGDGEVIGDSVF